MTQDEVGWSKMVAGRGSEADSQACVICFQNLSPEDTTCQLQCGHCEWHEACVQRWLFKRRTCPVCRAPQQASDCLADMEADAEDQETDSDSFTDEDLAELHRFVCSLSGPVSTWQPQLQDARLALERRVAELDEEHELLEGEMQRLQSDLHHLGHASSDGVAFSSVASSTACPSESSSIGLSSSATSSDTIGNDATPSMCFPAEADIRMHPDRGLRCAQLSEQCFESMQFGEEGAVVQCGLPVITTTAVDDFLVSSLVSRLRRAVLRAPSPSSIFHGIASPGGLLSPSDLARILCGFEAHITYQEVYSVFAKLDVGNRGFLDEVAWMDALQMHDTLATDEDLERSLAWELLGRIASALQRNGQSPGDLFRAIGGKEALSPAALERLLASFSAPRAVMLRAEELLDVGGKGQVQETDFHQIFGGLMRSQSV